MFDVMFAAIPFIVSFGVVGVVSCSYMNCLPRVYPEVVLVRAPFGFPTVQVRRRMYERKESIHQGPLYHLRYPIMNQSETEKAMVEITNRLPMHRGHLSTPWFVLHVPNVSNVSILKTLLETHGYSVSIRDLAPSTTKDGFPSELYYEHAESSSQKEDII